jgi:hypothetical protein
MSVNQTNEKNDEEKKTASVSETGILSTAFGLFDKL